jgi:predicted transcriptional regulator
MKQKSESETIRELTKAEEQIMQILWHLKKGMVADILSRFPDPKPAYNTVSTIIRILENKNFISHKAYGRSYEYFPMVSKKDYTRMFFRNFISNYFGNSYKALASFYTSEEKLSIKELEEIKEIMDNEIKKQNTE